MILRHTGGGRIDDRYLDDRRDVLGARRCATGWLMRAVWPIPLALLLALGCAPPEERELRMAYPYEIVTMDPHAHSDVVTRSVQSAVYEGLVYCEHGLPVRPWLADRWTTPDDTTWRLHVRGDVRFHDGSPLSPEDVVASIDRARSSKIVGHQLDEIDQVRVLPGDEGMIEITTNRPTPLLLTRLDSVAIVPRKFDPLQPVGTGPYAWQSGSIQGPVLLRRWADYWHHAADFSEVTIDFVSDLDRLGELLHQNQLDVVTSVTVSYVRDHDPHADWRVVASPAVTTTYLALNVSKPPLDDIRVRQAIDLAIDRGWLVASVFPAGAADRARSIVPPEIFGFSPDLRRGEADPARARELLALAGLEPGTSLRIDYAERYSEMMGPLADVLTDVGFRVETTAHRYDEFYRRIEMASNQAYVFSWTYRIADASTFLDSIAHSRDSQRGLGALNGASFSDPSLDELISQAGHEPRSDLRLRQLQDALTMLDSSFVFLPLVRPSNLALVREEYVIESHPTAVIRPQDVHPRR
jgi:peptide/nickel transport system substrate-binding protein